MRTVEKAGILTSWEFAELRMLVVVGVWKQRKFDVGVNLIARALRKFAVEKGWMLKMAGW